MYFEGAKLDKKTFTEKLSKRLAMKARVSTTQKHIDRAEQLVKDGAYDDYLKQYEKPKKAFKEVEKED